MIARELGRRSGFRVAPVNIGAMRLPQDADEAVALIRHAIDCGMTYIDTSRGYGDSEIKLGHVLKCTQRLAIPDELEQCIRLFGRE